MPARILMKCPYGHTSEFTSSNEKFADPHQYGQRITCLTCHRQFVYSYVMVTAWDTQLPMFEGVREVDGSWRGNEIRFVTDRAVSKKESLS